MRKKKYKEFLDEQLYTALKEFQGKRDAVIQATEKTTKALQRFAGSPGYDEDCKKAREKADAALKALRAEYGPRCSDIISKMVCAIDDRPIKTPTAEHVNVLSVLRMREHLTVKDLESAAEAVKDCPAALEVVQELAGKHGVIRNFRAYNEDMSNDYAKNLTTAVRAGVNDFLTNDTTRASRLNAQHGQLIHGVDAPLRKRPHFDSLESCYQELSGLNGDTLTAWRDIVDGAYFEDV